MFSRDLEELLQKWASKEKTFKRDIEDEILPFLSNKNVVFLYGPRRSGKSVVARRLLEKMPAHTITRYVNLEDPALIGSLNIDLLNRFSADLGAKDTIVFD